MKLTAIIPAGGAGTRLWPLSRKSHPKFLTDLTGTGRTLLQGTLDRLADVSEGTFVVTGVAHAEAVLEQVDLDDDAVLREPSPRDSMAAIGLAAAIVEARDPEALIGSFAADHLIADTAAFHGAVRAAMGAASDGFVVTIGIEPTEPSTGFGYIKAGESLSDRVHRVSEFLEKPDASTARAYVETGQYLWNAGMFVAKAGVLLNALGRFKPELAAGLCEIAAAWWTDTRSEVMDRIWPALEKIAIDHAIAEPLADEGGMAVVPAAMGWSDIGDYESLATARSESSSEGAAPTLFVSSDGAMVPAASRPVVVLGIEGAVVVEMDDVIFVTTREQAQNVKSVVGELGRAGLDHLT